MSSEPFTELPELDRTLGFDEDLLREQVTAILIDRITNGPFPTFWQPKCLMAEHTRLHGPLLSADHSGAGWHRQNMRVNEILLSVFRTVLGEHMTSVVAPFKSAHLSFFNEGGDPATYRGFVGRTGTIAARNTDIQSLWYFSDPAEAVLFSMKSE